MASFKARFSTVRSRDTLRAESLAPGVIGGPRITFMGRNGELRFYDGSSPPNYLSIPFVQMNFAAVVAQPRPEDPILETVNGYVHLPDGGYEEEFFQPTPVSFSCLIEDTTNSWKLRDALGNIDLHPTWAVGLQTWETTKGRGSVNLADNSWSSGQDFSDEMMVAVDMEMLWSNPHINANDTFGLQLREIAFYPQDQTLNESADAVELQVQGLCYGQIQGIRTFTSGTES